MKFVKNAHKAWSTWSALALVAALAMKDALPMLEGMVSEQSYSWVLWGLAIATPVLRFIDQGLQDE